MNEYIQIITLNQRINAIYKEKDGTESKNLVLFAALTDNGNIELIDFVADGYFQSAKEANNFLRFELVEEGIKVVVNSGLVKVEK